MVAEHSSYNVRLSQLDTQGRQGEPTALTLTEHLQDTVRITARQYQQYHGNNKPAERGRMHE